VFKNLLFGESVDALITRSFVFFYKSIETTILTNQRKISNAKDRNCILGDFLKLYLQNSFEENLKIIL